MVKSIIRETSFETIKYNNTYEFYVINLKKLMNEIVISNKSKATLAFTFNVRRKWETYPQFLSNLSENRTSTQFVHTIHIHSV